ncbi:MAG TPA: hypothetical protein VKR06_45005 [Ktedonosporobacter sp.]|nr:hypothetical protein [Ktedonosporobacter sp.]
MSQTSPQSPQVCTQCKSLIYQGQRFCPNCGALAQAAVPPTAAASFSPNTPSGPAPYPNTPSGSPSYPNQTLFAGPPSNPASYPNPTLFAGPPSNPASYPNPTVLAGPPNTGGQQSNSAFNMGGQQPTTGGQAQQGASYGQMPPPPQPYTSYSTPPPPSDPYAPPPPSDPYASSPIPGSYTPPQPKKRSPVAAIIIGVVVVLLVVCGGGTLAAINWAKSLGSNTTSGGGITSLGGSSAPTSQTLTNLSITYASDQMTFTSLQQASSFTDDTYTTMYGAKGNYVRVNFKEQQTSARSSYFSYTSSFHLLLPDKSVLAPEHAQAFTGPEQAVQRTNWIDFATNSSVDLTQLTLRVGSGEEVQMDIPLKSGADVSKYQPKTANLNKAFHYAGMNWTLVRATQSLSAGGKQATTGNVYMSIDLKADNPTSNEAFIGESFRLKSGSTVISPDYSSNTNNIDLIKPNTTNLQGTLIFLTPPSSTSTYTLDLLGSQDSFDPFPETTVDFQIS